MILPPDVVYSKVYTGVYHMIYYDGSGWTLNKRRYPVLKEPNTITAGEYTPVVLRWLTIGEGIEMQYKRSGNTYMVRIDAGEDIIKSLKKLCETEHILLGRVEAIGAADHAAIGVYDLAKKEYYPEEINEFMEITSLNGSITAMDGKPYIHLHATLADQNHVVHGGHVLEMRVGATCEMFVTVLDGEVNRQKDEGLRINLWTF